MEHLLQIMLVLVPDRRVAAILDEGPDIFRELLAAGHHRGGAAHGDSVHHEKVVSENLVGLFDEADGIESVQPAHLDGIALGIAVVVEIRDEDIVVERITVHPHQIEEADVIVGVAMDHDRRALGVCRIGGRDIFIVEVAAAFAFEGSVAVGSVAAEGVIPCDDAGIALLHLHAVAFDVVAVFFGKKGIVAHEFSDHAAGHCEYDCNHCRSQCQISGDSFHSLLYFPDDFSVTDDCTDVVRGR